MPSEQFFSYIMMRTSCISLYTLSWIFIVLNYNLLKQQSASRHVVPLGHIILILSQPVLALSP